MKTFISQMLIVFCIVSFSSAQEQDVTFLVCSDSHYGLDQWADNEAKNKDAIDRMNAISGVPYPTSVGGVVDTPRGVIVCGDLTDSGTSSNWKGYWLLSWHDGFIDDYGVNGDKRIIYPVYEGYGNHDIHNTSSWVVPEGVKNRNNSRPNLVSISSNGYHYAWEWDNLHLINLNIYPGGSGDAADSLSFLSQDLLANVWGTEKLVIIQHHYGFDYFSLSWWTKAERLAYYNVIQNYNVIGIFHGHSHNTFHKLWKGIDTYNIGCVKDQGFFVVNVTHNRMVVAKRSYNNWGSVWKKNIGPAPDVKVNGQDEMLLLKKETDWVDFRISLDPSLKDTIPHDYWIFIRYSPPNGPLFSWRFPGLWIPSASPVLSLAGGLTSFNNIPILTAPASLFGPGNWEFNFAVDQNNGLFEGTYSDKVDVVIY